MGYRTWTSASHSEITVALSRLFPSAISLFIFTLLGLGRLIKNTFAGTLPCDPKAVITYQRFFNTNCADPPPSSQPPRLLILKNIGTGKHSGLSSLQATEKLSELTVESASSTTCLNQHDVDYYKVNNFGVWEGIV